jgi:hypothetical protein
MELADSNSRADGRALAMEKRVDPGKAPGRVFDQRRILQRGR